MPVRDSYMGPRPIYYDEIYIFRSTDLLLLVTIYCALVGGAYDAMHHYV